jgi:glucokinase
MTDEAVPTGGPLTAEGPLTIGIDIGGTKVGGAVVDATGAILASTFRLTPGKSAKAVEDAIVAVVEGFRADYDIAAVGIGAAGFVDAEREHVLFAPHLAWRNEPLRGGVARRLQLPTVIENDANAAGWAEWRFGAGQGETDLICVTLGTGIGGSVVRNGEIARGRYGLAGEFGHMQVVPAGRRCECGNRGCWEQYASGNALVREARELARADSPVAQDLLMRAENDIQRITGPLLSEAALAGDRVAVELFGEIGSWLGVGIANLAAAFDPGTFVIGGGVSAAGELLIGPAREAFRATLTGRGFRPEARIVTAQLGPQAGAIGAARLALVS